MNPELVDSLDSPIFTNCATAGLFTTWPVKVEKFNVGWAGLLDLYFLLFWEVYESCLCPGGAVRVPLDSHKIRAMLWQ